MFLLPLLLAFTLVQNPVFNYKPLDDYSWNSCYQSSFRIIDWDDKVYNTDYTYCSMDGLIKPSFVDEKFLIASHDVFNYIDILQLEKTECIPHRNVEIFHINVTDLNDHKRFPHVTYPPSPTRILALYDPRIEEINTSSLIITNQGQINDLILAHEVSHYWFDRLCIVNQYEGTSEQFAVNFEQFYKNKHSR
jgi:hypothetical protein